MGDFFSVTEAAEEVEKRIGQPVKARELSDLLYHRRLSWERCPMVGRVRLIPRDYLREVCRVVKEAQERRRKPELATAGK
jgi:hypothetical protein